MADIPTDPRELARAILSGKVSLEDVAREQARRRGQLPNAPRPVAPPMPAVPPGPAAEDRLAPMPIQHPAPQARPRPPVRPAPRPVIRQPAPQKPKITIATPQVLTSAPPPLPAPTSRAMAPPPAPAAPAAPLGPGAVKKPARKLFATRAALRRGIIMAEVLGPPVSLRDERQ